MCRDQRISLDADPCQHICGPLLPTSVSSLSASNCGAPRLKMDTTEFSSMCIPWMETRVLWIVWQGLHPLSHLPSTSPIVHRGSCSDARCSGRCSTTKKLAPLKVPDPRTHPGSRVRNRALWESLHQSLPELLLAPYACISTAKVCEAVMVFTQPFSHHVLGFHFFTEVSQVLPFPHQHNSGRMLVVR